MKYSFNTWAFSHFPCWVPSYPIEEVIKRLAEIGYDALELGCAHSLRHGHILLIRKKEHL